MQDGDGFQGVVNIVDDAIIPDANAPTVGIGKFHATVRTWRVSQSLDCFDHPRDRVSVEVCEVLFQPMA